MKITDLEYKKMGGALVLTFSNKQAELAEIRAWLGRHFYLSREESYEVLERLRKEGLASWTYQGGLVRFAEVVGNGREI